MKKKKSKYNLNQIQKLNLNKVKKTKSRLLYKKMCHSANKIHELIKEIKCLREK